MPNSASFRGQVGFLRRQFLHGGDLPFTYVLTETVIPQALAAVTGWLVLPFWGSMIRMQARVSATRLSCRWR
jgi:hypothetical protein